MQGKGGRIIKLKTWQDFEKYVSKYGDECCVQLMNDQRDEAIKWIKELEGIRNRDNEEYDNPEIPENLETHRSEYGNLRGFDAESWILLFFNIQKEDLK